jgi:membrane fusion protein, multidrug efflux system
MPNSELALQEVTKSQRRVNVALVASCFAFGLMSGAALAQPASGAGGASVASQTPRVLLVPAQETTLVSQMVGRVNSLAGSIGTSFRVGQPVIRMECSEHDAKLRISEAEYNSAKENLDAKQRLLDLRAAGEVEVSMAAAAAEKAKAQIEFSKTQIRLCSIPAPFSGRIVKLHIREFQSVNVGAPLVDIVSAGSLKTRLNAPSKWLTWLRPGTKFMVHIDETGRSYPASVTAVNGRVDAVSQSIEIEGQVNGSYAELLAGMSGSAKFSQAQ